MKKIFMAISILMMSISYGELFAQKDGFSLHLSGVFPNGKFGEFDEKLGTDGYARMCALWNDKSITGAAGTGFGVGIKYQLSIISASNLRFLISTELMYNPLNGDAKEHFDKLYNNLSVERTLSKYLNIPFMVGLNYSFAIKGKMKFYGEFGIGANMRIVTYHPIDIIQNGYDDIGNYYIENLQVDYRYDNALSFAYQIGGGFLFDRINIGLYWYYLGSAKVEGNVDVLYEYAINGSIDTHEYEKISFKWKELSTSMLTLKIGFHF